MKLVRRDGWGARAPKETPGYLSSTRGVKVHYEGDYVNPALATNHALCDNKVRSIQNFHMDPVPAGRGWNDIAYNFLVCAHGYVFEGRGLHHISAANGPGLNNGHYAVCGLIGDSGLTQPSAAMLHGIRDAIEHCRNPGNAGPEIKGHRDGYATTCPGEPLYRWVKAGAPRPAPAIPTPPKPAPPPIPQEDDMPNGQLAEGADAITPISLPRGRYKTIGFIADNGLQQLPPATLRVAVHAGTPGAWSVSTLTVDSKTGQALITFPHPVTTDGISVRREDAGDVHVAYEVS